MFKLLKYECKTDLKMFTVRDISDSREYNVDIKNGQIYIDGLNPSKETISLETFIGNLIINIGLLEEEV